MKLSREWLGEYTTIGAPDKEYCDAMTMSGSKVEGWEVTGSEISRVVVGRVISMERHTNSDHMWVCKIDVGGERELQIVTGAQNVNIGDLVPVALDGSTLPGGKEIRTGKLRGELSEGMLCSSSATSPTRSRTAFSSSKRTASPATISAMSAVSTTASWSLRSRTTVPTAFPCAVSPARAPARSTRP